MEHNHDIKQEDDLQLDNLTKIADDKSEHKHIEEDGHEHEHSDDDEHDHIGEESAGWKSNSNLLLGLLILIVMLVLKFGFDYTPTQWVDFGIHFIAFVLAQRKVLDLAFRKAKRGDIFNEFVLMSVATIGAFYIGSYSEGVAVM